MGKFGKCISELLREKPVRASAPCRIDSGGTWDIKCLALPFESFAPVTVNLAINLRSYVSLLPYRSGWVSVSSRDFESREAYPFEQLPFDSRFGLIFSTAAFFGFNGVEVEISSDFPVNSGLGGSSAATVAAIRAFSAVKSLLGQQGIGKEKIFHLAYHLEDAVNGGMCGMQDHGAAVFGGANKWSWNYSDKRNTCKRTSILDREGQREISKRILLSYTGKSHSSAEINRRWVEDFLRGGTRPGWIKVNEIVTRFASHMKEHKWKEGAMDLREEVSIREDITPEAFIPLITTLIRQAESCGCGARFAGAGGGGAVWALGEIPDIKELKKIWSETLKDVKGGRMLDFSVDPYGLRKERI